MKTLIVNKTIRLIPNLDKDLFEIYIPKEKKKFELTGDFKEFIKLLSKFIKPKKVSKLKDEIKDLYELGALVDYNKNEDDEYRNVWEENNWEDFLFFLKSTENYRFNDISPDSKEQIKLKEKICKTYLEEDEYKNSLSFSNLTKQDSDAIDLKIYSKLDKEPFDFFNTIFRRKTTRDFNYFPVKAEYMSWVLENAFFEVKQRKIKATNDITSSLPNYTNSHLLWIKPLVNINNVEGIKSGLYEYNYLEHKLHYIKKEANYDQLQRISVGQKSVRGTGFTVFMKVDFYNIMWKYHYSSAYKQILISVAEMAQKIITCAVSLELGVFQSPAIKDSLSKEFLNSEVGKEEVLYCICVGNFNNSKNYTNLSKIYDVVMGDRTGMVKIVKDLIDSHISPKKKLKMLDLACGTGKLHEYFDKRFEITGVDLSSEMLNLAKEKHPQNKYIKADVKRYFSNEKFDIVTFNYDSINHLLTLEEWVATFESSVQNLKKNGLFIFDMNTIQKLVSISKENLFKTKVENYLVSFKVTGIKDGIYNWNINYEGNDKKVQSDNILETSFDIKVVEKELKKLFKKVEIKIYENGNRAYFKCIK